MSNELKAPPRLHIASDDTVFFLFPPIFSDLPCLFFLINPQFHTASPAEASWKVENDNRAPNQNRSGLQTGLIFHSIFCPLCVRMPPALFDGDALGHF